MLESKKVPKPIKLDYPIEIDKNIFNPYCFPFRQKLAASQLLINKFYRLIIYLNVSAYFFHVDKLSSLI